MGMNTANLGYTGKHAEQNDPTKKFQIFDAFDGKECQTIIEGIKNNVPESNDLLSKFHGAKENSGEMSLRVLERGRSEADWIYKRLNPIMKAANQFWAFDLNAMENLHFTEFGVSNNTEWKVDNFSSANVVRRKLSFHVMLSKPEDYREGDIELWYGAQRTTIPKLQQGQIIVYPSFLLNRIASCKRGPRYALSGWAFGKDAFK